MVFTLTTDGNQLFENGVNVNPVGSVICYAGQTEPAGWLFCDGTQVLKSDYPHLYAVITNTYGTASNSDYFVLPNLSEKIPMGNSNTGQTGFLLGNSGGNKNITLGVDQLPSHSHTGTTSSAGTHSHSATDSGHQHPYQDAYFAENQLGGPNNVFGTSASTDNDNSYRYRDPAPSTNTAYAYITIGNSGDHTHTFTTSTAGSGDPVNVLNPYLILNYIIKT
jgi:microcystin-dependent protein